MRNSPRAGRALAAAVLAVVLAMISACGERAATGPDDLGLEAAKGAAGGSGPRVTATDPDTGFRGTTINVQVLGSGFDQGSKATWALNGDTAFATTRVKTNSTQYVSSKKLIANITISADAPLDLYDVVVMAAGGKKGIGLELFAVSYKMTDLGTLGGLHSRAFAINDTGGIVGDSQIAGFATRAFLYKNGTMTNLGTLNGSSYSAANDINSAGEIAGFSTYSASSNTHAFLYKNGVMYDLHALAAAAGLLSNGSTVGFISLDVATAINDDKYVVGWGTYRDAAGNTNYRSFALRYTAN